MADMTIAVLVGSLRRESFNRRLAQALEKLAPPGFSFSHPEIGDLPLYNQDDDAVPSAQVVRLKGEIAAAKGILFVTPEYKARAAASSCRAGWIAMPAGCASTPASGTRPRGRWQSPPSRHTRSAPGTGRRTERSAIP